MELVSPKKERFSSHDIPSLPRQPWRMEKDYLSWAKRDQKGLSVPLGRKSSEVSLIESYLSLVWDVFNCKMKDETINLCLDARLVWKNWSDLDIENLWITLVFHFIFNRSLPPLDFNFKWFGDCDLNFACIKITECVNYQNSIYHCKKWYCPGHSSDSLSFNY